MKPVAQSKGFSVCLKGWTIPKYSLYGSVYGTLYVCLNARQENAGGYNILVWHNATEKKPGRWVQAHTKQGYGAIYCRIRDFVNSADFIAEKVIFCHSQNRDQIREQAERAEAYVNRARAKARREWERDAMCAAPRNKLTASVPIYRCKPQGGSLDYEYKSGINLDGYIGIPAVEKRIDLDKPFFEQGQNTAGDGDGAYSRDAFAVKRDGMKTRFADYHGQKVERPVVGDPYKVCKDPKTGRYYRTFRGNRIEEED